MSESVQQQMQEFAEKYISLYQTQKGEYPSIEHDEDWSSICELGNADNGRVFWQPQSNDVLLDFNNVSEALSITLHPDLAAFYGTLYSAGLDASFDGEQLQLLQVWNEEDLNMLQQNMISHILMKQQLKQQLTLFLAVTDDDTYIISLLNETGQVVLEPVGKEPTRVLAENLASFIAQLTPIIVEES